MKRQGLFTRNSLQTDTGKSSIMRLIIDAESNGIGFEVDIRGYINLEWRCVGMGSGEIPHELAVDKNARRSWRGVDVEQIAYTVIGGFERETALQPRRPTFNAAFIE